MVFNYVLDYVYSKSDSSRCLSTFAVGTRIDSSHSVYPAVYTQFGKPPKILPYKQISAPKGTSTVKCAGNRKVYHFEKL